MTPEYLTVYYRRSGLLIYPETAKEFGLRNGQTLSDALYPLVLRFNASLGLAKCHIALAKEKAK